jgi:hypothetical protein
MIDVNARTFLAVLVMVCSAAASARAEDRMRAGLWEVVTTTNGTPSGVTATTCYTPAMVEAANTPANMLRAVAEKRATRSGCALKDFKLDGNTVSMATVCGARSAVVSTTYSPEAFTTVDTVTEAGVIKTIRMKGRRIGDCK